MANLEGKLSVPVEVELDLSGLPGNGGDPPDLDLAWAYTRLIWKGKGQGPQEIGNGDLTGRFFKIGQFANLQIQFQVGSTSTWSSSAPYWYFQVPDLMINHAGNPPALGSVGSVKAFHGGSRNVPGVAKWSGAVGGEFGGWGIRAFFDGDIELGPNKPNQWKSGDTLQISIAYEVA
jgi:hypothetical protein